MNKEFDELGNKFAVSNDRLRRETEYVALNVSSSCEQLNVNERARKGTKPYDTGTPATPGVLTLAPRNPLCNYAHDFQ